MLRKFIAFSLLLVIALSCKKTEVTDYGPTDKKIIETYLTTHNLVAQSTASGLYYIIENPGGANHPVSKSKVSANYAGYLVDGTLFDSSYPYGKPTDLSLPSMILGWQEGLQLIGVGGKIKLLVPSALGYGTVGKGAILPNTVIIFDVELVDFY